MSKQPTTTCSRLDRYLKVHQNIQFRDAKRLLAQKRISVDGIIATDCHQIINKFSAIVLDDQVLQSCSRHYIMMHKPVGVVSATKDAKHKTVIDLLDAKENADDLHIAGRLDVNSSGLLLLTNDSQWSKRLSSPDSGVAKIYRVTLKNPISEDYIAAFAKGMYFEYENITTRPVKLKIISLYEAEVHLQEGRYHQIKRMFGRFRNPVIALHRVAIGKLILDEALQPGEYRHLSQSEAFHFH